MSRSFLVRVCRVTLCGIALSSLLNGYLRAQGAPEIAIKEVRWQPLPEDIGLAYVAPDQSTWFVSMPEGEKSHSLSDIKQQIELLWSKHQRVVHGVRPALFEKDGRTWFTTLDGQTLLAYDGKSWIERAAQSPPSSRGPRSAPQMRTGFIGDAPGHGHSMAVPVNLDLGNTQIFVEASGFSAFDGGEWHFQAATAPSPTLPNRLLPYQKTNAAYAVQFRPGKVWRFRDHKWSEIEIPPPAGRPMLQSAVISPDGILLVQSSPGSAGGITRIVVDAPVGEDLEKSYTRYLNKIDNADSAIADAAAQAIATLGPGVEPLVQKTLENIVDEGAAHRLRGVLEQLHNIPREALPQDSRPVRPTYMVGKIDINQHSPGLWQDASGLVLMTARNLPEEEVKAGNGAFVFFPDGKQTFVPGQFTSAFTASALPAPFVSPSGKNLFILAANGLMQVDLSAPAPTARSFPDSTYNFVQAIAEDGTMYLGASAPWSTTTASERARLPILVYKPAARDERQVLHSQFTASNSTAVLAPDGTLWCSLQDGSLSKSNGAAWTKVWDHQRSFTELFPGQDGAMLVWQASAFSVLFDNQRLEAENLDELIAKNPPLFARAFRGPGDPRLFRETVTHVVSEQGVEPPEGGWSVAGDADGNVWMTFRRSLRIYHKGEWINVAWPETDAALPGPSLITPLADGKTMYIYGTRKTGAGSSTNDPEPKAFLARFKESGAEFTPAPWPSQGQPFLDGDNALWIQRRPARTTPPGPATPRLSIQRVAAAGVLDSFEVDTPPLLLDRSGYTWLTPANDTAELWKGNKKVGEVHISAAGRGVQLFSEKPGSAWAWTPPALFHFVAGTAGGADYQLRGTYAVESEGGENLYRLSPLGSIGISPRGFLYTYGREIDSPTRRLLHLVTLPER